MNFVEALEEASFGHHTEFCVVRPLTNKRVAEIGPSGERCEGEVACVEEWHSSRCEAHWQRTDRPEPNG